MIGLISKLRNVRIFKIPQKNEIMKRAWILEKKLNGAIKKHNS